MTFINGGFAGRVLEYGQYLGEEKRITLAVLIRKEFNTKGWVLEKHYY